MGWDNWTRSLINIDRVQLYSSIRRRLTNRRVLRNSGLLMLANIIVVGLNLVRTPAATWILPKEQFGMIGVVGAWLPYLQLLSLPGMDTASYHYISRGEPWAFSLNLKYRLRWSLLSIVALLLAALYWYWQGNPSLSWLFIITAFTYPLTTALSAASGALAARENFLALFWYRLAESLAYFAGFIPLLLSTWWISQVVTFYTANQLVIALLMVSVTWWLLRQFQRLTSTEPPAEEQHTMIRYGQHQTVLNAISSVQARADLFLISTFSSLATMADYSIGTIATNQLRQLWSIFLSIRYPPLARMPLAQRRRRFVLEGIFICSALAGAGLLLVLASYWFIPLLLPPSYSTSIYFITWLTAITLTGLPGGIAEIYFRTQQDERHQYQMRIFGAITSIIFPLLLLLRWEVDGILIGRLVSNLLFSIFGVWLFIVDRP